MLTMDKKGVPNTIPMDQATDPHSNNTDTNIGEERNANGGRKEIFNQENQEPEDEIAESEQCDTDGR